MSLEHLVREWLRLDPVRPFHLSLPNFNDRSCWVLERENKKGGSNAMGHPKHR